MLKRNLLSPKSKKLPRDKRKRNHTPEEMWAFYQSEQKKKKIEGRTQQYPGEFLGDPLEACAEEFYNSEESREDAAEARRLFGSPPKTP